MINSDNGGSGSNDDNDVKDYGDNYVDSYSNHQGFGLSEKSLL